MEAWKPLSLKEAISNLPDALREPLILHFFNGMKLDQIAQLLGISLSNVGMRIYRAKIEIKAYVKKKGGQ